jgi:hypothetical protein
MPTNDPQRDDDRRITLNQLYAACVLILLGACIGLVGEEVGTASTGLALGTAVIGAGATLLPSHMVTARSGAAPAAIIDASAITPITAPALDIGRPSMDDHADALAAEDPTLAGVDLAMNGDGDPAAASSAPSAGRQAHGDL